MADQILRERRRKAAEDKELERQKAEEIRDAQVNRRTTMDDRPLVGNLVGTDHVNYVLMYNMLTGIRVAVSTSIISFPSLYSLGPFVGIEMSGQDKSTIDRRRLHGGA